MAYVGQGYDCIMYNIPVGPGYGCRNETNGSGSLVPPNHGETLPKVRVPETKKRKIIKTAIIIV